LTVSDLVISVKIHQNGVLLKKKKISSLCSHLFQDSSHFVSKFKSSSYFLGSQKWEKREGIALAVVG